METDEIDRASYNLGFQVSREVYLKRVRKLLEKERDRYDSTSFHTDEGYLALTHAIAGLETIL